MANSLLRAADAGQQIEAACLVAPLFRGRLLRAAEAGIPHGAKRVLHRVQSLPQPSPAFSQARADDRI